jgi:hypothetical protein
MTLFASTWIAAELLAGWEISERSGNPAAQNPAGGKWNLSAIRSRKCAPISRMRGRNQNWFTVESCWMTCGAPCVRSLLRSQMPEKVAMAITGHKTRAVFDRYNIVSENDVTKAGRQLEAYFENGDKSRTAVHHDVAVDSLVN